MYDCTLVSKLQAILLMEAGFNFSNKMIYGVQMMNNVRKFGWMPEEIYSEKGKTADDGSLAKVLFYDIVRQASAESRLVSSPLTQLTVTTALLMQSRCWSSKHLASQRKQLNRC